MSDHVPDCPRAQAWDHFIFEAPCTCPAPEGRVFALTGPQMLELADLLDFFADVPATAPAEQNQALQWVEYFRREHAAHFGEDAPTP